MCLLSGGGLGIYWVIMCLLSGGGLGIYLASNVFIEWWWVGYLLG